MERLRWKRLREASAVADAPALLRADAEPDLDDVGGPGDGDDDDEVCPTCHGDGIVAGAICTTCYGSGSVMKESDGGTMCAVCLSTECNVEGVERVREAVLTAKARKAIPKAKFAIPEKAPSSGSYPIHDRAHAIAALSYSSGKPEEGRVKAAVYKAYPDLKKSKESDTTLLERMEALEQAVAVDRQILRSLREAKPASMTPVFSNPTRVKTSAGQEGYQVTLIREGRGNSEDDQWYTREAIQELCESGVCEGMQAFGNHPTEDDEEQRPERDVKELVGTYHDVKLEESGGKVRADAIFVPLTLDEQHPRYGWVVTLAEAATRSTAQQPICGISLYGLSAGDDLDRPDGTHGRMVSMIRPSSGDIVTNAGAGGGFIRQLMESARALRDRSRKELDPMKAMAYQNAVREATKRVREATSDEDRTTALEALSALEAETIDNVPDTIAALREAAPKLVEQIEEQTTAAVKESDGDIDSLKTEVKELRESNNQLKTTLGGITDAIGVTEALREAGVEDPIEMRHYAGMAQQRQLREAADIKEMVETDKAILEKRNRDNLAAMREAFELDLDTEIEGAGGRIPVAASLPTDGGVEALRESGLPTLDAE